MKHRFPRSPWALAALLALAAHAAPAAGQELSKLQKPEPTVPEVFTLQGQYVRVAYNNEGFVTLGYRMVQQEVGNAWALLTVGVTIRAKTPTRSSRGTLSRSGRRTARRSPWRRRRSTPREARRSGL